MKSTMLVGGVLAQVFYGKGGLGVRVPPSCSSGVRACECSISSGSLYEKK